MTVPVGELGKKVKGKENKCFRRERKKEKEKEKKEKRASKDSKTTVRPLPTATSHCSFLRSVTTNVVNPGMTLNFTENSWREHSSAASLIQQLEVI